MVYLLAALFPPLTLPRCRNARQAVICLVLLVGAIVGVESGVLSEPLPALLSWWMVLLAVGAVPQRRATARAEQGEGFC